MLTRILHVPLEELAGILQVGVLKVLAGILKAGVLKSLADILVDVEEL